MKVLHIAPLDRTIYHFRLDLLNRVKSLGFETYVICSETVPEYIEGISDAGHHVITTPIARNIGFKNITGSIQFVRKKIKEHGIQVVHTHTPIGGAIGRVAASMEGIKHVLHTTGGWYFHDNMVPLKHFIFRNIEKYLANKTDYIFSVNKEDIETAKKLNIRPRKEIIYSGPAGVNMELFSTNDKEEVAAKYRRELGISKDQKVIGLVGRLVWEKGFREFIDTLKLIERDGRHNFVAIVAGIGPQEEDIKEYAKQAKVDHLIQFLGYRTDVFDLMKVFDIYLFPSHREGVPVSVQEAMAMEIPVVAFNIRGCREVILQGETGYFVPFKNTAEMAKRTVEVLGDGDLSKRFGALGRKRIGNEYTKEHHVERQIPAYMKILNSSS